MNTIRVSDKFRLWSYLVCPEGSRLYFRDRGVFFV
jgi:hypothetical protein